MISIKWFLIITWPGQSKKSQTPVVHVPDVTPARRLRSKGPSSRSTLRLGSTESLDTIDKAVVGRTTTTEQLSASKRKKKVAKKKSKECVVDETATGGSTDQKEPDLEKLSPKELAKVKAQPLTPTIRSPRRRSQPSKPPAPKPKCKAKAKSSPSKGKGVKRKPARREAVEPKAKATKKHDTKEKQEQQEEDDDDDENQSDGGEDQAEIESAAKRNAHRLYMKFWRNIHESWGPNIPTSLFNKHVCPVCWGTFSDSCTQVVRAQKRSKSFTSASSIVGSTESCT